MLWLRDRPEPTVEDKEEEVEACGGGKDDGKEVRAEEGGMLWWWEIKAVKWKQDDGSAERVTFRPFNFRVLRDCPSQIRTVSSQEGKTSRIQMFQLIKIKFQTNFYIFQQFK